MVESDFITLKSPHKDPSDDDPKLVQALLLAPFLHQAITLMNDDLQVTGF